MKKIFKSIFILFIFLVIFSIILVISLFSIMKYMEYITRDKKYYDRGISILPNADYIVVPGAKVRSYTPELYLQHRLDYAYILYVNQKAPKIIVSGGFDEKEITYEANVMYEYLIKLGVPEEDIIRDLQGNSTYETLKRTKDFIGDKSIIFCTQELYSPRAVYIAQNLNLDITIFCSDPMIYRNRGKNTVRESLAQVKAILNCKKILPHNTFSLDISPFIFSKEEQ